MGDRTTYNDNTSIIARRIQGMVFPGTPFRGSRHAKWADTLQRIVGVFSETNTNKTRDLQENSDKLKELAEAFPDVLRKRDIQGPRIGVVFFIETLKCKKILVKMIQYFSSEITLIMTGCGGGLSLDTRLW